MRSPKHFLILASTLSSYLYPYNPIKHHKDSLSISGIITDGFNSFLDFLVNDFSVVYTSKLSKSFICNSMSFRCGSRCLIIQAHLRFSGTLH